MDVRGNAWGGGTERGATATEYGLIVAIIVALIFAAVQSVGDGVSGSMNQVAADVAGDEQADADPGDADGGGSHGDDAAAEQDEEAESADDDAAGSGGDGSSGGAGDGGSGAAGAGDGDGGEAGDGDDAEDGEDGDGDAGEAGGDDSAVGGSSVAAASKGGSFTWWNDGASGGNGEWAATVAFSNSWIRHQYLDLEVTTTTAQGKSSTSKVTSFYVPAGGSAEYVAWSNSFRTDKAGDPKKNSVMTVSVRVTGIRTSDEKWQTVEFDAAAPTVSVKAPSPG